MIREPQQTNQIDTLKIASQVNMVSKSWDGRRVYFSSSLLANWDKKGDDNEQYLKAFAWDGQKLSPTFRIDFIAEKLGRPHQMRFGARALYGRRGAPKRLASVD